MATTEMLARLPKLDDDAEIGVEKEHVVPDDGYPDIKFRGTLLASVAPENRGQGRWREYRVYRTAGGRLVFSKVGRSVLDDERDKFEANAFGPYGRSGFQTEVKIDLDPPGLPRPEQLIADLTGFFKFDDLAKQLYAKLGIDTTRHID